MLNNYKQPNKDDLKNEKQLESLYEKLILALDIDKLKILRLYIDLSHGTHDAMKSHAGKPIPIGKCSVCIGSTKNINKRSSNAIKFVASDEVLPQLLWTKNV